MFETEEKAVVPGPLYDKQLQRLLTEQQIALKTIRGKIEQLKRFISDYERVIEKITENSRHFSKSEFVPLGKKCLVPAKLIHTNEVLIHLGDDFFAEVTVPQGVKILQRRIAKINENLKDLSEQQKLLTDREGYIDSVLSGHTPVVRNKSNLDKDLDQEKEVEISEDLTVEDEAKWRETHKKHLKQERSTGVDNDSDIDIDALLSESELAPGEEEIETPTITFLHHTQKPSSFKFPISAESMSPSQAVNYFIKHKHLQFKTSNVVSNGYHAIAPTSHPKREPVKSEPVVKRNEAFIAQIVEHGIAPGNLNNDQNSSPTDGLAPKRVSRFKESRKPLSGLD